MRVLLAGLTLVVLVAAGPPASALPGRPSSPSTPRAAIIPVEFWCSPGFEPRRGSCVATLSRDELFIYDVDDEPRPPVHRRHRRHGLRTLY